MVRKKKEVKHYEPKADPYLEYITLKENGMEMILHQPKVKVIRIPAPNQKKIEHEMYLLTRFKKESNVRLVIDLEKHIANLLRALSTAHCSAILYSGMVLEEYIRDVMAQTRKHIERKLIKIKDVANV